MPTSARASSCTVKVKLPHVEQQQAKHISESRQTLNYSNEFQRLGQSEGVMHDKLQFSTVIHQPLMSLCATT